MKDWKGNDLEQNNEVYLTEDGLVKEEDMNEYIGLVYSKMKVYEYRDIIERKD